MPPHLRAVPDAARAAATAARCSDVPDAALLDGYARSDPDATSMLLRRFQGRVFGLTLTIVGDPRVAEEIAQEAFLRAWRHAGTFDARRGSVATWLLTITRNLAVDAVRARRTVPVSPDDLVAVSSPADGRDPGDVAVLSDDLDRVRAALTRLPDEQRRAVVFSGVWGLTAREVAERDRIPLGTAKTRIRTGLQRLRSMLREDDDGPTATPLPPQPCGRRTPSGAGRRCANEVAGGRP